MTYYLGVDTGGTFTDAVVLDAGHDRVIGKAKALTTRHDLSVGIGGAVDAALADAGIRADQIVLVSMSTTLATNALVEGQGGRVALLAIGFDAADLARAGLEEAMKGDPVVLLNGGHSHAGIEAAALDEAALTKALSTLGDGVMGFAVAARFATRNPAHERRARDIIRAVAGRPVTCSHELSAQLNGPKRALTAVLNARLVGMIDSLVRATERHLVAAGIDAPLMVVRGDGALISAEVVRERPIETILSGPAASIVGARWLTNATDALVSDIGGTTTDIALLRDGLPEIDPNGARVGGFRTMVEAVAMRTTGLGGDSEVHLLTAGLNGGLRLGPRRLLPVSLIATTHGAGVHAALDRWLMSETVGEFDGRFVLRSGQAEPSAVAGLSPREAAVYARIDAPVAMAQVLTSRLEVAALDRLVSRGLVMIAGVTPTDASHALGRLDAWDAVAAAKSLRLMARRRTGAGERFAADETVLALSIIDQVTAQTVDCLLESAFAEDEAFASDSPDTLARHRLTRAGLDRHRGVLAFETRLAVPVIGLGASASAYYGAVGDRLGCPMILPEHAGVANAIGAVVGQVSQRVTGLVSSPAEGRYVAHLPEGLQVFSQAEAAMTALEAHLEGQARQRAAEAGAQDVTLSTRRDLREADVEGRRMFLEATVTVTASGRPRVARATG